MQIMDDNSDLKQLEVSAKKCNPGLYMHLSLRYVHGEMSQEKYIDGLFFIIENREEKSETEARLLASSKRGNLTNEKRESVKRCKVEGYSTLSWDESIEKYIFTDIPEIVDVIIDSDNEMLHEIKNNGDVEPKEKLDWGKIKTTDINGLLESDMESEGQDE